MAFLDDWKLCKRTFEAKAGKKPSETFLGVFRKSSGMEDAAKGLDTALQKLDPKEIDKAAAKYRTTSESYQKLLLSSFSKEDSGQDYKAALAELARGMGEEALVFCRRHTARQQHGIGNAVLQGEHDGEVGGRSLLACEGEGGFRVEIFADFIHIGRNAFSFDPVHLISFIQ